jgi:hypothetical protein
MFGHHSRGGVRGGQDRMCSESSDAVGALLTRHAALPTTIAVHDVAGRVHLG